MNNKYKDKIDEGFIEYVLHYCGLKKTEIENKAWLNPKFKETRYRQIKRELQKQLPFCWESIWDDIREPMTKMIKTAKKTGSFNYEIKRIEGKRKEKMLAAILILKGYFTWKLGSPHWRLIGEILEPFSNGIELAVYYTRDSETPSYPIEDRHQKIKKYFKRREVDLNEDNYAKDIYKDYKMSENIIC